MGKYSAVGSFHPNASGHASGYAVAFDNYIKAATNRTVLGYPANPPALPSSSAVTAESYVKAALSGSPAVTVTTTDVVQTLTVQPVTAGTTDCEGTYMAGQQVDDNAF